jgi:hypothetical protein
MKELQLKVQDFQAVQVHTFTFRKWITLDETCISYCTGGSCHDWSYGSKWIC